MLGKHKYLWKVLVWAMIPFTLAASLPRMHCRCAQAQGLMFCDCCFSGARENVSESATPVRKCCRHKSARQHDAGTKAVTTIQSSSACPTCTQMTAPAKGNCCSWNAAVLAAPSEGVGPSIALDLIAWDMTVCDDSPSVMAGSVWRSFDSVFLPRFFLLVPTG
jgi:hypothetical protein